MDEVHRRALEERRRALAVRREADAEAARVAPLTSRLAAGGTCYRLFGRNAGSDPDWLADRVPSTITHLDWTAIPHEHRRLPELGDDRTELLRCWLAPLEPGEELLVVTSNGADPIVGLPVAAAIREAEAITRLDPFELWLSAPTLLIEFRWPDARRLSGG